MAIFCKIVLYMPSTNTIYLTEFSSAYSVWVSAGVTTIIYFNLVLLLLKCSLFFSVLFFCKLVHEDRAQCFDLCIIPAHKAV